MKLYMAAPLFTEAERLFNKALAIQLRTLGYKVHLPQDEEPAIKGVVNIAMANMAGVQKADVVLACCDGADVDSGTAWECGYAVASGKPVVLFRTDFRSAGDSGDANCNLMLAGTAVSVSQFAPNTSITAIAHRLHAVLRKL
jgi:nucleoside 2-deoxyribosyltransferase